MIAYILCFLVAIGSLFCSQVQPLKLVNKYVVETGDFQQRMDLSGLTTDGSRLFTISDLSHLNQIFEIEFDEERARLKVALEFKKDFLDQYISEHIKVGRFDIEGITWCNGSFYLTEESTREVLRIDFQRNSEWFAPDFHDLNRRFPKRYALPFSGIRNAGLEGIACDSKNAHLYLLNERQFRMGFVYSLRESRLLEQFAIPASSDLPKKLRNLWVYPDFAGGHFEGGNLHLLSRNQRQILVIEPGSYRLLHAFSYAHLSKDLYDQTGVFGVMEGLTKVNGDYFLVTDHNLWNHKGSKDQRPILLRVRP